MSVEYKFENPDDLLFVEINKRVNKALEKVKNSEKDIEILKIDKESLSGYNNRGSSYLARNLILKIDYLIRIYDENKE
mgnify:FL=1